MSKKNENIKKASVKSNNTQLSANRFFLYASLVLVIITSGIYLKSLNNPFTKWDDDSYVSNNYDIRTLHGDSISYSIKNAFTSYEMGNYHPLTMLSYSIEYNLFKLNPKPYHATNLFLHLLNTLLVLYFIWLLTKQQLVAFITALLFAIHPMHVESVAWVAERKDVLYSFFYLASLCAYLFYRQHENKKSLFYISTLLLFVLACLSKGMAVSLPLLLLAIDYYNNRKFDSKTLIEKIPFFAIALTFGIVAIKAQQSVEALYDMVHYNFMERILFSCYGIMMYLWKLIMPINLSCYYSYPDKLNGMYPIIYYLSPFIIAGLMFLLYKSINFGKDILFGCAFFIITIVLVLQILPVGGTVIAERYSYLPYIGVFFIIAKGLNFLIETKDDRFIKYRNPAIGVIVACSVFYSIQSYKRTKVWESSLNLWNDAIEKYDKAPLPFKCRAVVYYNLKDYDKAIADLNKAIALQNTYAEAYNIRGQCYNETGNYTQAIEDFNMAIKNNPNNATAYNNRGITFYNMAKFNDAINDYNMALSLDKTFMDVYNNRGNAYFNLRDYQNALNDYLYVVSKNPYYHAAYNGIGLTYSYLGNLPEAINYYSRALSLNPQYAEAYLNRGNAFFDSKKYNEAINDYSKTIELSSKLISAYYFRAGTYFTLQKYKEALKDALTAQQLGYPVNPQFIEAIKMNIK